MLNVREEVTYWREEFNKVCTVLSLTSYFKGSFSKQLGDVGYTRGASYRQGRKGKTSETPTFTTGLL